jgi:hypothetical protein
MSADRATLTNICISRNTFEAWRRGEKVLCTYRIDDENFTEEHFRDTDYPIDIVKHSSRDRLPKLEDLRKRLANVNDESIKADLLYVIRKYDLENNRWRIDDNDRNGSYVFFLRFYLNTLENTIQRRFAEEEYVDPEEWEWMKDADDYSLVLQYPYLEIYYDEDDTVEIVMWG